MGAGLDMLVGQEPKGNEIRTIVRERQSRKKEGSPARELRVGMTTKEKFSRMSREATV
jgi:hypothetical protein